jgi:Bacterial antitoxin of type II TA system, VapB
MQVEIEVEDELLEKAWVLMGGDPSLAQLVEVALHAFITCQLARKNMAAAGVGDAS